MKSISGMDAAAPIGPGLSLHLNAARKIVPK